MQKIDFYVNPSKDYGRVTIDDVLSFGDNINSINKKDKVYVPNEFYEIEDVQGKTAIDFLYEEQNDMNMYLFEIIREQKHVEESYADIKNRDYIGYLVLRDEDIEENRREIFVHRFSKNVISVKRYYAMYSRTYDEYINCVEDIFPNIVFHKQAFDQIEKLGVFKDVKNELHRHLTVLNDYAKKIYFDVGKREERALRELETKYNIVCSGKGNNERKDFKVEYRGKRITCNPHTKLFSKQTDQRIYFCWGRDDIEGHNIIIAKIGNHWE